jgi:hypothetical protein
MNICPSCGSNCIESDYDEEQGPFWCCKDCGHCEARAYHEGRKLKLHKWVEFSYHFPWQLAGWKYWPLWFVQGSTRERLWWNIRILGLGIDYSCQPMTDEEAEELLQFIYDEQAAGEEYDLDPIEFHAFHDDRGDID